MLGKNLNARNNLNTRNKRSVSKTDKFDNIPASKNVVRMAGVEMHTKMKSKRFQLLSQYLLNEKVLILIIISNTKNIVQATSR